MSFFLPMRLPVEPWEHAPAVRSLAWAVLNEVEGYADEDTLHYKVVHHAFPQTDFPVRDYVINVAFGMLDKDAAIEGLAAYLRKEQRAAGALEGLVRSFHTSGSHVLFTLYDKRELKLPVHKVASLILSPYHYLPDALQRFTRVVERQIAHLAALSPDGQWSLWVAARAVTEALYLQQAVERVVRAHVGMPQPE